mgnify:FL=1
MWPCPNGCPRDAGEYCNRHSDEETLEAGMELEESVQCEKCDKMITLESDLFFDGVTSYCEKCAPEDDASTNDLSTRGAHEET